CGPRALHPPFPLAAVRGDDRPLQGSVPCGAAPASAPGAHVAAALRDGRAFLYAGGHRRPQALRAGGGVREVRRRAAAAAPGALPRGGPESPAARRFPQARARLGRLTRSFAMTALIFTLASVIGAVAVAWALAYHRANGVAWS